MSRFCTNCGNQLKENEAFCTKCGKKNEDVRKMPVSNLQEKSMEGILKVVVIVSCVLMIIATFLPYLKVMGESVSLVWADGKPGDGVAYIALALVCILALYLNKKIYVPLIGICSIVMYFVEMYQMKKSYKELGRLSELVSKGTGFYLITIAVFMLLISGILYYVNSRARK